MANLSHKASKAEQHDASPFTLGVVMAGIFAFFVAGIASAFIYAKDTSPTRSAQAPPAAASVPAETTGAGGGTAK